jgi:hypothetical protein
MPRLENGQPMRSPLAALVTLLLVAHPVRAAQPVDYLRDVKPILKAGCYSCHGALRQKHKLRLDTAESIRKGGKSGPAVEPGKSGESLLIDAVTGKNGVERMPPRAEGEPLSPKQIAVLKAWIDQGAKGPRESIPEDPRRHWAFRAPVRPPVPHVADPAWAHNPIDAFIAAEHQKRSLRPVAAAARPALLRRVYLDLIGLPPTRAALHEFLPDNSPDAYEKVVDRLLASPQYGERWARHWMDVWRYSDWYGRRAVPDVWNSAPQIWRWRDWIVRSLNRDKGYDRMVVEMLAADEVAPEDDEAIVATGYIVRNWYALNYNQWMRDLVEHTGKAFLGLTLNCAHCHDHKYDPISQEEYFRFRAFFEPLELRQDRVPGEPDPGPFQKYQYVVLRKIVRPGLIRVFDEHLGAKTYMYRMGDERLRFEGKAPVTPGGPAFLSGDRLKITPVALPATAYYPGLKPFVQKAEVARCEHAVRVARSTLAKGNPAVARARLAVAEAALRAMKTRLAADNARYGRTTGDATQMAVTANEAERFLAFCTAQERLIQAEATPKAKAGQAVNQARQMVAQARRNLTAPGTTYTPLSPVYPTKSTGRRTALARWIASRENPLTARVAVNHIWMRHFGKPLVETVFDFGRNGKRPTHPELLDWLAVEFMESGWGMKQLHRLIVTSSVYRMQSSPADPDNTNLARDRDNRALWHFELRQLEAELVRDALLAGARQLDQTMGGQELENDQGLTSRRRSLYFSVHPENGGHLAFLELFDAPDPCDCYRRSETIAPQQALALTNSKLALNMSRLLARKLWREAVGRDAAFVVAGFEQVLSRPPSAAEKALCLEFLGKQTALFRKASAKPVTNRGLVAPAADPGMRARESLIRALFNHNDFVMIR